MLTNLPVSLLIGSVVAVSFALIGLVKLFSAGHRKAHMPPGPPTLPIIGNEHLIPRTGAHFKFQEWAKRYGGVFSLKRGSATTLVITDREAIRNLLDKKSGIYSRRPDSFVARTITQGDHMLVMDYSDTWRHVRKLTHQYFMESVCENEHIRLQEAESKQMIYDFMKTPERFMRHPKRFSNSIINSLVFGIRTSSVDSDYMTRLYELMERWSKVMEQGNTPPVDTYPWLHAVPEKLLGNWRSRAEGVGRSMTSLYSDVLDHVEARRARGHKMKTMMDLVLDANGKNQLTRNQVIFLGGVLMEGGSDTSSSILLAIIQAMTKYPDVLEKAQKQIDALVGADRVPNWNDIQQMPYINMIVKEAHRWRPVTPLSFPHALGEDDWYKGMLLPKGSTVIINVWGLHMDPTTWSNPAEFQPERYENHPFLAPEYAASRDWTKRDHYGYGAGRRICPGIHLAERNLLIGTAQLLWAFDFREKKDGVNDSSPLTGYSEGFLHCANSFDCAIEPRSEKHAETIMREYSEAQQEVFSQYDA